MNFRDTLHLDKNDHLIIGGKKASDLVREYGTPLYVYDEQYIRDMCRAYKEGLAGYTGGGTIKYASKAFSCKEIYRIMASEGMGCDVVSGGELYTALAASFPADQIYFHGNNKSNREINEAVNANIGAIVIDAFDEIDMIEEAAERTQKVQKVLVRLNPAVNVDTHEHIKTATPNSKFGFSIADGSAMQAVQKILQKKHIKLEGFSAHLGSQFFDLEPFYFSATSLLDFAVCLKDTLGFVTNELNLGGGFGVPYLPTEPAKNPQDFTHQIKDICAFVLAECATRRLNAPRLAFEPGRSIVASAGVTLYTVGATRLTQGKKKYVCVDGGMFESPRYALYGARYECLIDGKNSQKDTEIVDIAGKCCESGDIIASGVALPKTTRGDTLAVLTTGAYNYSMASHYNRNFVPPVVSVMDGKSKLIIKPENYEDITRNDI